MSVQGIKKIEQNKDAYAEFLTLADPSESNVKEYLSKGDLYVIENEQDVICGAVVVTEGDVAELKNISTNVRYQKRGYGTQMVNFITDTYSNDYTVILGTGGTGKPGVEFFQLDFYRKCGFEEYRIIKNFFVDNYPEPIFEDNGEQCVDMIYLKYIPK